MFVKYLNFKPKWAIKTYLKRFIDTRNFTQIEPVRVLALCKIVFLIVDSLVIIDLKLHTWW